MYNNVSYYTHIYMFITTIYAHFVFLPNRTKMSMQFKLYSQLLHCYYSLAVFKLKNSKISFVSKYIQCFIDDIFATSFSVSILFWFFLLIKFYYIYSNLFSFFPLFFLLYFFTVDCMSWALSTHFRLYIFFFFSSLYM